MSSSDVDVPGGQVVGQDIRSSAGLRVVMAQGFKDNGSGTISATHANGGYCSVRWDNGTEDRCLFTGQQNDFYLVTCPPGYVKRAPVSNPPTPQIAPASPPLIRQQSPTSGTSPLSGPSGTPVAPSSGSPPASGNSSGLFPMSGSTRSGAPQAQRRSVEREAAVPQRAAMGGDVTSTMQSGRVEESRVSTADAGAAQLHKQLLAQEVVKLRREVATLRASGKSKVSEEEDEEVKRARVEIANLEQQKASIIAQANAQKALLAKEVKNLRAEIEGRGAPPQEDASAMAPQDVALALERRKEFEENFTRTLRDLRKELDATDLKVLGSKSQVGMGVRSMLQLSNERVEKVMEEAAQVPVEERLHIETLRLLMENCKLRKCLNDHCSGLLSNTLSRVDDPQDSRSSKTQSGFSII
mmetsp:Transcript_31343/g.74487  ORF Transcript_31343/g.74487 Transcript_31343/m.74487 type:complete len:412 (+) Transcript_31343:25-1260(+)